MRAFVFPGQGAQTVGMGQDLAAAYPAAKAVFDEVDDALGESLSALIWDGDIETLTLTENAQPALMATSIAVLKALESEGNSTVPKATPNKAVGNSIKRSPKEIHDTLPLSKCEAMLVLIMRLICATDTAKLAGIILRKIR